MSYRDSLSPADQTLYDQMIVEQAENRAHNRRVMDEAGVPRPARRGFNQATLHGMYRIAEVTEYPRPDRASRWGVFVELYEGSFSRDCYLVGPRGAARKIA